MRVVYITWRCRLSFIYLSARKKKEESGSCLKGFEEPPCLFFVFVLTKGPFEELHSRVHWIYTNNNFAMPRTRRHCHRCCGLHRQPHYVHRVAAKYYIFGRPLFETGLASALSPGVLADAVVTGSVTRRSPACALSAEHKEYTRYRA